MAGAIYVVGGRLPALRVRAAPLLVLLFGLLVLVMLASILLGARVVSVGEALSAFLADDGGVDHSTILSLRVPRTIAGILAGVSLGLSGALMQALTRNPLADTGVLGINAGATFAMVVAIGLLGIASLQALMVWSFIGAGLATLAVYAAASAGRGAATPLRLVLAGVAIGSILRGLTASYVLTDPETFDRILNWDTGSLAIVGGERLWLALPFVAGGTALALSVAPALGIVALGDQTAQALGTRLLQVRTLTILAVMLLTGASTAMVGPIGFLGLMAPQIARALCGTNQKLIFACTLLIAPAILLAADIIARLAMRPVDIPVGLVSAIVGAPVLIWFVRRRKVAAL